MRKLLAVLVLAVASCRRAPPPMPTPTPTPPPPPAIIDASASVDAAVDPNVPIKDIVKQWNDAINAKDLVALGALHDTDVRFYGVPVDNKTYVAKMKAALAKDPAFHQDVDSLRVEWTSAYGAKVWFRKKDNKADHAAYLVLRQRTDGRWTITEESDFATDVTVKCLKSADKLTLTGKIGQGAIIWHDLVSPITVIVLSPPVCVERSGDDDWAGLERMDGVESIMIENGEPKLPIGTKVRVTGSHVGPHIGSGAYSAPEMFVDSTTRVP